MSPHPWSHRALRVLAVCVAVAATGCTGDTTSAGWSEAQAMWEARDPRAYAAWRAIADADRSSEASRRLEAAARRYALGIEALERGDDTATAELRAGAEIAPLDPTLYLRLAQACRAHGAVVRAASYYR